MDWSGGPGQLATAPLPPLVSRARCTSLLEGSRFGVKLVSRPQSPPSPSPLSTRHNCVISSQERKFSVPILSRSCLKFAFPRARVPKLPGTPECETRNARPSLPLWLSNLYYYYCIRNVSVTCTWWRATWTMTSVWGSTSAPSVTGCPTRSSPSSRPSPTSGGDRPQRPPP